MPQKARIEIRTIESSSARRYPSTSDTQHLVTYPVEFVGNLAQVDRLGHQVIHQGCRDRKLFRLEDAGDKRIKRSSMASKVPSKPVDWPLASPVERGDFGIV